MDEASVSMVPYERQIGNGDGRRRLQRWRTADELGDRIWEKGEKEGGREMWSFPIVSQSRNFSHFSDVSTEATIRKTKKSEKRKTSRNRKTAAKTFQALAWDSDRSSWRRHEIGFSAETCSTGDTAFRNLKNRFDEALNYFEWIWTVECHSAAKFFEGPKLCLVVIASAFSQQHFRNNIFATTFSQRAWGEFWFRQDFAEILFCSVGLLVNRPVTGSCPTSVFNVFELFLIIEKSPPKANFIRKLQQEALWDVTEWKK